MRATSPEAAEAIERVQIALAEAEQARADYDAWMASWRARRGYVNGYDRDTGIARAEEPTA